MAGRIVGVAAGTALLASLGALGVSFMALDRASTGGPSTTVAVTTPAASPSTITGGSSTTAPSTAPTTPSATTQTATSLPTLAADYSPAYQGQALSATPLSNGRARNIDFDEPAIVGERSNTELAIYVSSGVPSLNFETSELAVASQSDVTPAACADLIKKSPADTVIPASRDLVICLATDGSGAVGQVSRQKMVVVTVTSVDQDGSVFLSADAWDIPS